MSDANKLLESNLFQQLANEESSSDPLLAYNSLMEQSFQSTAELINQSQALLAQNQATIQSHTRAQQQKLLQQQQQQQQQQQRLYNQRVVQHNAAVVAERQALLQSLLAKTVSHNHEQIFNNMNGVNNLSDIAAKREKIIEALKAQNEKHSDAFTISQQQRHLQQQQQQIQSVQLSLQQQQQQQQQQQIMSSIMQPISILTQQPATSLSCHHLQPQHQQAYHGLSGPATPNSVQADSMESQLSQIQQNINLKLQILQEQQKLAAKVVISFIISVSKRL